MLHFYYVFVFWTAAVTAICHDSDNDSVIIDDDRCLSPFIPFDPVRNEETPAIIDNPIVIEDA